MTIYEPGANIADRYEIVSKPMMGGMGVVYFCVDLEDNRKPVALKTFKPKFLPDRAARDRFLQEGTTWISIGKHPNIVTCYGIKRIRDGSEIYLILELVGKQTGRQDASLRSWLKHGKSLRIEQSLLFTLQIARAMKYATTIVPGIVHRDLKPENILVWPDFLDNTNINRISVTDFGLAATTMGVQSMLQPSPTHEIVGTPLYMAPEQWQAGLADLGMDIYAFGCILYEMLAGQSALSGKDLQELKLAHRHGRVRTMPNEVPTDLAKVIQKCMAVSRADRYSNWNEVETAISNTYVNVTGKNVPGELIVDQDGANERISLGWSYNEIGGSYLDISKFDTAKFYFERVVDIGQTEKNRELEAAGYGNLGTVYYHWMQLNEAIRLHELQLGISQELGDQVGEGKALGNLANAYAELGDPQKALEVLKRRLAIAEESKDLESVSLTLMNIGLTYFDLKNVQLAVEHYEVSLAIAQKIKNRATEGIVLGNLGQAYGTLGDVQRAMDFFQQSLDIARSIGDRQGEAIALGNLGNASYNAGDKYRAIELLEQCLEIAREIKDEALKKASLQRLGSSYSAVVLERLWAGAAQGVIKYLERWEVVAQELGDGQMAIHILGNMGVVQARLGNFQAAIDHFQEALIIAEEIGDHRGVTRGLGNLANAYADLGDVRSGAQYIRQYIPKIIKSKHKIGLAIACLNFAIILFKKFGVYRVLNKHSK